MLFVLLLGVPIYYSYIVNLDELEVFLIYGKKFHSVAELIQYSEYRHTTTCPQARVGMAKRPTVFLLILLFEAGEEEADSRISRFQDCRLLLQTFVRVYL